MDAVLISLIRNRDEDYHRLLSGREGALESIEVDELTLDLDGAVDTTKERESVADEFGAVIGTE